MDYYSSLNASGLDPDFPTVFELLSAQELQNLIHPSLRYIIVHYAQRNPQYLLKVANRFDELYLVLFGVIEYYHLKHWNATFTERFYGIKRSNILSVPAIRTRKATPNIMEKQRRLTKKQVWLSLGALVVLPYINEKLLARYERLKGKYTFNSISDDKPEETAPILDKLTYEADILLLTWYPRYTFAQSCASVLFIATYLFHQTTASSPLDWLLRFRYSRISKYDCQLNSPKELSRNWLKNLDPRFLGSLALNAFNYALPSALFLLKFFEWWNSSDLAKKLTNVAPLLGPPQRGPRLNLKGCALCGKDSPETASVLESGVIFCYKCIYDYLQNLKPSETPRCPVTGKVLFLTTWHKETDSWQIEGIRRLMV